MTKASASDSPFLKDIKLPQNSVLVFDRGYNNFAQYERLSQDKITWITRERATTAVEITEETRVNDQEKLQGVIGDQTVILGNTSNKRQLRVNARRILFYDQTSQKTFSFLTNNRQMKASTIAQLYPVSYTHLTLPTIYSV